MPWCFCHGRKSPGHQYPQYWLNIRRIGSVPYRNYMIIGDYIKKYNYIFEKKITRCLRLKGSHVMCHLPPPHGYIFFLDLLKSDDIAVQNSRLHFTVAEYSTGSAANKPNSLSLGWSNSPLHSNARKESCFLYTSDYNSTVIVMEHVS